jgi:hypothetical protein
METADEFIASFLNRLERRKARARACQALLVSDVPPPQTRLMLTMRRELCPVDRCNDVDRAILGASLGG